MLSILFACQKGATLLTSNTDSTATTSSTSLQTTQTTTEHETTTVDHEVLKASVEDKINFYKAKLIELSGLDEEMMSGELSFNNPSSIMLLSTWYDEYDREDLPEQVPVVYEGNGIDPEFMINTTLTINNFLEVLDVCTDFVKDNFMEVEYGSYNYLIKASVEGDQLYIESYHYYADSSSDGLWTNIMYFDLIEGKVIFKYVRDYLSTQHYMYYDEFSETGDAISIALDVKNNLFTFYQIYNRETNMSFDLSNTSTGGIHMNYIAIDGSSSFGVKIDEGGDIIRYSMRYGSPTQFWYTFDNGEIYLTWNLYLAQGWNRCWIYSAADDHIFMDDTEVLEDFSIGISIQDAYANARLTTTTEEFTESMMNLTEYGLYFDAVTYSQLQADIDYMDQNFLLIMGEYGLSLNMEDNYDYLLNLFPFVADDTIIQEIAN